MSTDLPTEPAHPLVGREFGQYRVVEYVTHGGMGEVFRARDTELKRDVALKGILPERFGDPRAIPRFVREARHACRVSHPYVATVHGVIESDSGPLMVLEWIDGRPFEQVMLDDKPDEATIVRYAREIAEALIAIHDAGLVHRDLKPSNVMVQRSGHVKVMDFGLAVRSAARKVGEDSSTESTVTGHGGIAGTYAYMSPEQAMGQPLDARSDLFSLGVMLYQTATGRHPFLQTSMQATRKAILEAEPLDASVTKPRRGLVAVARRLMQKDPDARYQSARELLEALESVDRDIEARVRLRRVLLAVAVTAVTATVVWGTGIAIGRLPAPWSAAATAATTRPVVAILPFEDLTGGNDAPLGRMVADLVSAALSQSASARGVALDRVVESLAGSPETSLVDKLAWVAGHVGAEHVVTGTLYREGDEVLCTLALYSAGGTEQQDAISVRAARVTALAGLAASRLYAALGVGADPVGEARRAKTLASSSDEAQLLYERARGMHDQLRYAEATPLLDRAVEIDAEFLQAWLLRAEVFDAAGYDRRARDAIARTVALLDRAGLPVDDRITLSVEAVRGRILLQPQVAIAAWTRLAEQYPDDPTVLLGLAGAQEVGAAREQALETIRRAIDLDRLDFRLHLKAARILGRLHRHAEADDALDEAARIVNGLGSANGAAEVARVRASLLYFRGDYAKAAAACRDAYERFAALGLEARAIDARKLEADMLLLLWQLDEARPIYDEILPVARRNGQYSLVVRALGSIGAESYRRGAPGDAVVDLQEALDEARKLGNEALQMTPLLNLAAALNMSGRLDDARGIAGDARAIAARREDPARVCLARIQLADTARREGRFDEAEALLDGPMDGPPCPASMALYTEQALAMLFESAESPDRAERAASAAVERARASGSKEQLAYSLSIHVRLLGVLGLFDEARRELEEAEALLPRERRLPEFRQALDLAHLLVDDDESDFDERIASAMQRGEESTIRIRLALAAAAVHLAHRRPVEAAKIARACLDDVVSTASDRAQAGLVLARALEAQSQSADAVRAASVALARAERLGTDLTAAASAALLARLGPPAERQRHREIANSRLSVYLDGIPEARRGDVRQLPEIAALLAAP